MKTKISVFVLNPPHWPMMQNAPNFRETEKDEMVLFCQTSTLNVKERTEHSQTCELLVS